MLRIISKNVPVCKCITKNVKPDMNSLVKRCISLKDSKPFPKPEDVSPPGYEVTSNKDEWQYVERLLRKNTIPEYSKDKTEFPSGWVPPKTKDDIYFVQRTKNHMLPVYLRIRVRGMNRRTVIKNIYGDIWQFAEDLRQHLQSKTKNLVAVKIHEISGTVYVHNDYVNNVKLWLLSKGM